MNDDTQEVVLLLCLNDVNEIDAPCSGFIFLPNHEPLIPCHLGYIRNKIRVFHTISQDNWSYKALAFD